MPGRQRIKQTKLIAFVVLSIAVVGYFVGLQSPAKPAGRSPAPMKADVERPADRVAERGVVNATRYSDMPEATALMAAEWRTSLTALKNDFDPLAEVVIQPTDKEQALAARSKNRAFNGAPPTVPHPVDQRSDAACVVCHQFGVRSQSLRIPQMSHPFYFNCTQCHVENDPTHMRATLFGESDFVGLPAPNAGPRAFPQAPPMIPHSTWMRNQCASCHGPTGLLGIRTTHPWRDSCQQCHAPSAELEQTGFAAEPQFLPLPTVNHEQPDESFLP